MRIQEIQRTGSQGPKPKQPPQPVRMQLPDAPRNSELADKLAGLIR